MFSYPSQNPEYIGRCRRCGRALRTMESIRRGIGPVCLMREIGQGRPRRVILRSEIIPRLFDIDDVKKKGEESDGSSCK